MKPYALYDKLRMEKIHLDFTIPCNESDRYKNKNHQSNHPDSQMVAYEEPILQRMQGYSTIVGTEDVLLL
jgi:hypothetical protein